LQLVDAGADPSSAAVTSPASTQLSIGSYGAFWLFAAILVVSMVFIISVVPETQGKSLEDIEKFYAGKIPPADAELSPALQRASGSYHRVSSLANIKLTPSQIF
jgi:hypothetical protein